MRKIIPHISNTLSAKSNSEYTQWLLGRLNGHSSGNILNMNINNASKSLWKYGLPSCHMVES